MDDYGDCVATVAELRQQLAAAQAHAERVTAQWLDEALALRARAEQAEMAVPVISIETVALWALKNSPPDYVSYACKIIAGWISEAQFAQLQTNAKPSPVVAFAELSEKYHQYFDAVLDVTDAAEAQP